jgi:hypothetical protein
MVIFWHELVSINVIFGTIDKAIRTRSHSIGGKELAIFAVPYFIFHLWSAVVRRASGDQS